jgi:hypothetical protein
VCPDTLFRQSGCRKDVLRATTDASRMRHWEPGYHGKVSVADGGRSMSSESWGRAYLKQQAPFARHTEQALYTSEFAGQASNAPSSCKNERRSFARFRNNRLKAPSAPEPSKPFCLFMLPRKVDSGIQIRIQHFQAGIHPCRQP